MTAVAGTADGEAVTGSGDGLLRRWALGGADGEPSCSGALLAHPGGVTSLASASTAASGQLLYSAGKDGVLRLWRPADGGFGQPVATFKGHTDAVQCVAAAPGAQQLASCGWDGVVRLWRGGASPPPPSTPYNPNAVFNSSCLAHTKPQTLRNHRKPTPFIQVYSGLFRYIGLSEFRDWKT